ncbi:hypothetical protein X777_11179 [Ooceraea biroi]|uniref:Uncharacterized protein n=1 Tax=Ooceraea biroi TaxID=2015173 RepID=A0A026W2X1_OOCBI|nr:hypothetical protein X777_11179 [Ooceraea biroi]
MNYIRISLSSLVFSLTLPPRHLYPSVEALHEVRVVQRGGIGRFAAFIDERMYPQSNAETLPLQSLNESANIGEFNGIEHGGAITSLPIIVDLNLAVVELIGNDLIRIRLYHFLSDVSLVPGPSGPDGMPNHSFIGMTVGFAQMGPHHVLMSEPWIREDAHLIVELNTIALTIRCLVLGDQAQVPVPMIILVVKQRICLIDIDVDSSAGQPVTLGQCHVCRMRRYIWLLLIVHVLYWPMLIPELWPTEPLRAFGELVAIDELGARIGDHASNLNDFVTHTGLNDSMCHVAAFYAKSVPTTIRVQCEGSLQYTRWCLCIEDIIHILAI